MCNTLHDDSEEIPKEGTGWKIFRIKDNKLNPLTRFIQYEPQVNGRIVWKSIISSQDGFCFFLKKEEAEDALYKWLLHCFSQRPHELYIKKIQYYKGLGKQLESTFISGFAFEVALCKEFEVIEEGENVNN